MSRTRGLLLSIAAALFAPAAAVEAATVNVFTNPADFAAQLGASVVDSFDHPGYGDPAALNVLTNAAMTGVRGETEYETTGFDNLNIVFMGTYCAGCNGSFRLAFTGTSVGSASGVFGVGFLFAGTAEYVAHVILGDGSVRDVLLPPWGPDPDLVFFGITSPELIASLHIGGPGGGSLQTGFFGLDDLTIGSAATAAAVPEPGSILLLGAGLLGVGLVRRRSGR